MGAFGRIRMRVPLPRPLPARRLGYASGAAVLTAAAVVGLTGCDPTGGLDSATVALTTQRQASLALRHADVDVNWLSCRGKAENGGKDDSGATQPVTIVGVDCEGRTGAGKKIIVYGKVTGMDTDACVRGLLTAKVDGKTVFSLSVLGDCSKGSGGSGASGGPPPPPSRPPSASPDCPAASQGPGSTGHPQGK